jgi:uncharacterized protein YegL
MTGVQLIISQEPVARRQIAPADPPAAHVAVVYSDAAGQLTTFEAWRRRSWPERRASRLLTRYLVDVSDHRRSATLETSPLPSRGDTFFFQTMVDVGFRVCDPLEVVRHNTKDGLTVVYSYLLSEFRVITRHYDITESGKAEAEINRHFQSPRQLPREGIEIYYCRARLLPDGAAQEHLRAIAAAERAAELGPIEHANAMAESGRQQELAGQAQAARLAAEKAERDVLASHPIDLRSLLQEHLARHPDETAYAVELLERHEQAAFAKQDIDDKRSIELIRYMMEQGLIQAADVDNLRRQTLGRVQDIAAPPRRPELPATSWDDPLPVKSEPVVLVSSGGPASLPAAPAASPTRASPAVAIPVYLMIDESVSDAGYFDALNTALAQLPAELAAHPEVIQAVRLAVLGYAGDVALHMPLNAVAADSFVPRLAHRDGSRLGPVFEYLQRRIPDDVQRLKSRLPRVGRPVLHILCAGPVEDGDSWPGPYRQLLDRATFPYSPNIIACGAGTAPPGLVQGLAPPPELGWLAGADLQLAEAAARYITYIRESVIAVSRAHIGGSSELTVDPPQGYDPAGDGE